MLLCGATRYWVWAPLRHQTGDRKKMVKVNLDQSWINSTSIWSHDQHFFFFFFFLINTFSFLCGMFKRTNGWRNDCDMFPEVDGFARFGRQQIRSRRKTSRPRRRRWPGWRCPGPGPGPRGSGSWPFCCSALPPAGPRCGWLHAPEVEVGWKKTSY